MQHIMVAFFSWCLVSSLSGFAAESPEKNPNIVFILVDDMGYGDPGCYNPASKIPTPHIDSLAREGMRFTDAHAPGPLCHMSRYGLLTGCYPFRTDVEVWRKQPLIDADQMTIASLLKSSGYRTEMVGKWHLGFEENGYELPLPGGPVDRGFDSFFGIRASTDIPPYFYIRNNRAVELPTNEIEENHTAGWRFPQGAFWRKGRIAPNLDLKEVLPCFTDEAVEVIESHAKLATDAPLFLYVAFPAPHTPWLPAHEFLGSSGASMYGDFSVMVDSMIGRVLTALKEAGMSDDTLVIFASDNGPMWYEEDVERFGHDSSGGLRGMKGQAWECGHRMPFLVRWPGKVAASSISNQTISFIDMLATFASIVGVELPSEAGPDSFDFLPVLLGNQPEEEPIRDALVIQTADKTMTIRIGDWKLITAPGSGGFSEPSRIEPGPGDPPGQLYNLAEDLGETNNLYLDKPAVVKRLLKRLAEIRDADRSRFSID